MKTMKKPALLITTGLLALSLHASAQRGFRTPDPMRGLSAKERTRLSDQASSIFTAAKPAVTRASKSTVAINADGKRVALGTAVSKNGKILTKWSEISSHLDALTVITSDGTKHRAQVTGVYKEHDLAIVQVKNQLTPIDLSDSSVPELGNFLALANAEGSVEGFGVVSVKARSLREGDKAYLGVMMDFSAKDKGGVPLRQVVKDSAAAKAGLRDGDIITSVDNKKVSGAMEMRNLLQRLEPGSEILVRYRRNGKEQDTKVTLGSRNEVQNASRVPRGRLERMQRMGTVPSRVRSNFANVIQTDMPIEANDAGAPVVDLDGKVVGIAIARGSRIKTFIIPTAEVKKILVSKPDPVRKAIAAEGGRKNPNIARRNVPQDNNEWPDIGNIERLLSEMERNNAVNDEHLRRVKELLRELTKEGQPKPRR